MASGASHADVAILLVDARSGVKKQTKRHAAILDLVGVKRVVLAVNKMDLVGYSEDVFRKIEADFRTLCWKFGFWDATAIPLSAVYGDNVSVKSDAMPWYTGPHLLEHLEKAPSRGHAIGSVRSACRCKPCCATARISAASPAPSPRASSASAIASPTL